MSEEYNEEIMDSQESFEEGEEMVDESAVPSGRFDKLLGNDSRKFKLSGMFKDWFLDYSSYVILQRAVPHIVDGLKPVQRRVLHAMYKMDDGAYTKVANIVGQAMQYHPHGDASILGALVQIGQKGYAVDCQGNWGNILTGDSNAAPRYIEARLSKFAKEVIFDPKVTNWMTSYDGRNQEPTELPVRFPLLLAQGTEGIAVGMASKILPHNFNELLDASIAILEGKPYEIYPDFPTGGYADCSKYQKGRRGGVVKVRAKIEKIDKNTISITEIPYSKTSGIVIDSILKAKDKGKIKIKKIDDMTTDHVEIIIHLPNDVSPDKTIDALYAFTDCEINISPNACVIKDNKPQFMDVNEILEYDTFHTRDILERQLRIKLDELENEWHYSSLERIFFENRIYKVLEQDQKTWEEQIGDVFERMKEYQDLLTREIVMDDILKLVEKPVRKISKFDTKAIDEKIRGIENDIADVKDKIAHITRYTIDWFKGLKKKYGKDFPRLTEITSFETIAATKVVNNNAKLYANKADGFVGTDPKKIDGAEYLCDCSDIAEIVVFMKNGKYVVTKVKDKAFIGKDIIHAAVFNRKDERTVYNVVYRDGKPGGVYYAKRFAITGITRDKEYDLTQGKPGSTVLWFTANSNGEAEVLRVQYRPRPKLKKLVEEFDFAKLAIKGRASRGNVVTAKNSIHRITLKAKGVSTLAGKQIWLDEDIVRLNDAGRGRYLGEFSDGDLILVLCKDGTYYTTGFDLSTHFQGDLMRVEKFDPEKTFSALYYDGPAKAYYIKRFSFEPNAGIAVLFIAEGKGSKLLGLSEDRWPQLEVTFKGKSVGKEPERIDVEQFIGKKGFRAKGKKVSSLEVKSVQFIEPLVKEEPEEEEPDLPEEPDTPDEPDTPTVPDIGTDTPAEPNWSNPDEPTLF